MSASFFMMRRAAQKATPEAETAKEKKTEKKVATDATGKSKRVTKRSKSDAE